MVMGALGAAGVCIGDWVEQHRRVLGTRRVVGPGLVLQAATVRASDEQLTTFGGKKNFLQIVMLPCTLMRWTASARHGGT